MNSYEVINENYLEAKNICSQMILYNVDIDDEVFKEVVSFIEATPKQK